MGPMPFDIRGGLTGSRASLIFEELREPQTSLTLKYNKFVEVALLSSPCHLV